MPRTYLVTEEEFWSEEYLEDVIFLIRYLVRAIHGIGHDRQSDVDIVRRIFQSEVTLQSLLPLRLPEGVHCDDTTS